MLEDSIELHNRLESRLKLLNLFYDLDILIGKEDISVRMIIYEG